MEIKLLEIPSPQIHHKIKSVKLSHETLAKRKKNLLEKMKNHNVDSVIIYADREHGANFEYFTGFIPRFEEACLVVHADGESYLLLGNENLKLAVHSRIKANAIHVPFFSLPNQPMDGELKFEQVLSASRLQPESKIGIIGWKYFTSNIYDNSTLFDVPYYVVDAIKTYQAGKGKLINFSFALISPNEGIRTINNANEIAHYEYGATLAGSAIFSALQAIEVGRSEKEVAGLLAKEGQPNTVMTICASGPRYIDGQLYPQDNIIKLQDNFSMSVGYKGGLSSRAGFVINDASQLPDAQKDYLDRVAKPYFKAYITWLETIKVGCSGDTLYNTIEQVLPKQTYGWKLNPGHFTADEEWMASPFFNQSTASVQSGQLFQIDIIPSVSGYSGVGCEEPVAIADKELREAIKTNYPDVWARIEQRRQYLKETLNINIHDDVLPLSDTVAFYTPFFLNKNLAFTKG